MVMIRERLLQSVETEHLLSGYLQNPKQYALIAFSVVKELLKVEGAN